MKDTLHPLSDAKPGDIVQVQSFSDSKLSLKLMEMGFLPGTTMKLDREAPLGCPVVVSIGEDYHLSLRKSEAQTVLVKLLKEAEV